MKNITAKNTPSFPFKVIVKDPPHSDMPREGTAIRFVTTSSFPENAWVLIEWDGIDSDFATPMPLRDLNLI